MSFALSFQGRILEPIKRYGRLGKSSGDPPAMQKGGSEGVKEVRFMYLAIDEAVTHVGVKHFR